MKWTGAAAKFDADSKVMLQITLHFLQEYFGHDPSSALNVLTETLDEFPLRFDEDFVHGEGPYRFAATCHFISAVRGDPTQLGHWLWENNHNEPPREALEYFNRVYFIR